MLGSRTADLAWATAVITLSLLSGSAAARQPTVNGLYHGDGDDALYNQYAVSQNGSVLYSYYHAPTTTLYVALVVDHGVNDVVCSSTRAYTQSVGWGPPRPCDRLVDSEFAAFTLECAPGSPDNAWTWQQGFGCANTSGPPASDWVSDPTCGASSPAADWPPGTVASTSWVANVNTYQANTTPGWNLYDGGTAVASWSSPDRAVYGNDATAVPGYPTYSGTVGSIDYDWEWSMVYEWSVDLGAGGANCGGEGIFFISGLSHHSPAKNGQENDPFDEPSGVLSDWGDLPDSYATLLASNGPRHQIKVTGPYLGAEVQPELDGTPTADASGDGAEEDGLTVTVTSNWTAGSTQTIEVVVSNAPVGGATLGGWFDWNGDGDFGDAGEFSTWSGLADGTHTLSVTVGSAFDWQSDDLAVRLRLFSSGATAPGGSLDQGDFSGEATDGEVEDHLFSAGALPVTLNSFISEVGGGELAVRWQTASETENVAFELWGLVGGAWRPLSELVETRGSSSALPQTYEVRVELTEGVSALRLVDYDFRGRVERFGPFSLGAEYGEEQPVRRIDWSGPRARREARLRDLGFSETGKSVRVASSSGSRTLAGAERWRRLREGGALGAPASIDRGPSGGSIRVGDAARREVQVEPGALTHLAVRGDGIQRVTYEEIRDGGLDLAGVRARDVAVTFRGEPVPRWIGGPSAFGPGSAIEFLGRGPSGGDALYIDANLYQVTLDRSRVEDAKSLSVGRATSPSRGHLREVWVDRPVSFHVQSPTGDPWIERTVLTRAGIPNTIALELPVDGSVLDGASRLTVVLGAITDLPDQVDASGRLLPEHNVEVWFRGAQSAALTPLATASRSGNGEWTIEATIPNGELGTGVNQVELRFSTEYLFSLVVLDRYGARYPSPYVGPTLDFARDPNARGYRIEGFATTGIVAYAEADKGLTRLDPRIVASPGDTASPGFAASPVGYSAELRDVKAEHFWVTEAPHRPQVFTTEAPGDLLSGVSDLLVLSESSFVGTPALEEYVRQRSDLNPVVIDLEDVYNAYGFGMALPSAITDFLRARDALSPYSHVQLVGADCFDRQNYVSDCVSFVPLPSAPVDLSIYSPSQNELVDLDGDGVGDKAIAQFSVRDESELARIVDKTAQWDASGLSSSQTALLIAEETDGIHDFRAQADRLRGHLGWEGTEILDLSDHPAIATARSAMRSALDAGRALTLFSGHSSPTVWAFRSLLTTSNASDLTNAEQPTLMVPLACETTYDISPSANVLGHQLLFGEGSGVVAISGAVALASLGDNEQMARHVLSGLERGLTLGEAVLAGRQALGASFQTLQDNWLTQGDVALKLQSRAGGAQ